MSEVSTSIWKEECPQRALSHFSNGTIPSGVATRRQCSSSHTVPEPRCVANLFPGGWVLPQGVATPVLG